MNTIIKGELEIDTIRGVIYFHTSDPEFIDRIQGVTVLRICSLPKPIPNNQTLDLTHMYGVNWGDGK